MHFTKYSLIKTRIDIKLLLQNTKIIYSQRSFMKTHGHFTIGPFSWCLRYPFLLEVDLARLMAYLARLMAFIKLVGK